MSRTALRPPLRLLSVSSVSILPLLWSCTSSPLQEESTADLRRSASDAAERETVDARQRPQELELTRKAMDLSFPPDRMTELESMAGPKAYEHATLPLEVDLFGEPHDQVLIDLRQAITRAVANNLSAQSARLDPAIGEARLVAAEAAFDWVFFSDVNWTSTDEPGRVSVVNGLPLGVGTTVAQSVGYTTGIRKSLTSGGAMRISQGQTYYDDKSPGATFVPDPSNAAFLELGLDQPLLRGFGSDVALAEVRLSRNAERGSIQDYRATLLSTVTDTERAYWLLAAAQRNLLILQRLLERGIETRDVLKSRLQFDVKPAEYSDAVARVESRRADVLRAQNTLRQQSDRLKALINDPELTVGSETLLLPADTAIDAPVAYSLLDSITTALARRPEVERAVLAIDDASIRQTVADNSRLPLLNLAAQSRFQGLNEDVGEAYDDIGEARFVDFLVRLAFEQPIGNRGAEAVYRARQLERSKAVIEYRRVVQEVVLDVKLSLRSVQTNYALIEQTRSSRLAAAENLRTLQVQEQTIQSLTPDFLDLKFRRQESLAQAEQSEVLALIDYNIALSALSGATGMALERNNIRFVVPEGGQNGSGSESDGR